MLLVIKFPNSNYYTSDLTASFTFHLVQMFCCVLCIVFIDLFFFCNILYIIHKTTRLSKMTNGFFLFLRVGCFVCVLYVCEFVCMYVCVCVSMLYCFK